MRKSLRFGVCFILLICSESLYSQDSDWDITAEFGPTRMIDFTTTEGTWMNLDVSPDGSEIVFDLMGDIYSIPIEGGKARLISGGPAYDVQPRFSPDGSKISFTSDRSGGDNIWIMDRNGENAQQVTEETFRLLNNSTWSPDGDYIVAKKHFSSTRSLGAGEMWMYHVSGGLSGIQLTERKNDQQDVGMPAFSSDGNYLYFSEDMSPGPVFQYNKDPNGQIYMVRRLDMETNKITSLIGGAGGATKPEPSPDGRYVAFIRRVRLKSVLYLYDLETGAEIPVYDKLDKDQQEVWAIFGTYPNYDWTPDGKNIIIWSGGKINKISVDSKASEIIPFEADVSIRVTDAVRFKQNVFTQRFESKMIRNTVTSPDERTIVFNAIGYLWKKSLPDGEPVRLTSNSHFEFFPSFSPDGKWVIYSTWSDDELGALYKTHIDTRESRKLTQEKGYFYSPSFSPDGASIVYRKGGGDGILGTIYSKKTGIYTADNEGNEHTLIREEGSNPTFNNSGKRLYYTQGKSLRSVTLDNKDEKTYFTSEYATSFVPSPDEKWIAFTELFHVYIAPFPKAGKEIDLSSTTKAYPVKKLTKYAGSYPHWSSDSRNLHWTLGGEYFTRNIGEAFSFVDGAASELPEADETGIAIGLTGESDVPGGKVAFTGARIITMQGDEVIENGTIVVEGNKITAVGTAGSVTIPGDALRIPSNGKTIMPGMIDVHAHIGTSFNKITPNQQWTYYVNLAYGVTTAHDPSSDTEMVFSQSEMIKAGKIVGPRLYSTGTILYGAEGDFKAVVDNYEDAYAHLKRMKAVGAFSVKSYNQPRRNQRQQILKAARDLEMLVVPEGGSTFYTNMTQVIDGHTSIEHNTPVAPLYNDVLTVWGNTNVGYTPTLIVNYGSINGEYYWYQHTNVWENKRLLNFTPRTIVDSRSRRRQMLDEEDFGYIENSRSAKALLDSGAKVQLGAHGQLQGLGAHWEMWMLEQGGMTPLEAIRSATLSGAQLLGLDEELGSIEAGKLADLVILDRNPLDNIRNSEFVNSVMVNGRLYDAETMNEIGNHPKSRMPFYWENPLTNESFILDNSTLNRLGIMCGCVSGKN